MQIAKGGELPIDIRVTAFQFTNRKFITAYSNSSWMSNN